MIVIGIDPGLSGAIALYDTASHQIEVHDMPTLEVMRSGKKKREISPAMVAHILSSQEQQIASACVERVGAMPGQGVTSVFSFGYSTGVVIGALAACGIPTTIVTPKVWQMAIKVRGGKDGSRQRAMEIWPDQADLFERIKDDGRSDAALIAIYGAGLK